MRNKLSTSKTDETYPFIVELANGQTIKAHAGPSGLPIILSSALPADLPAFTEQCPPSEGHFSSHWDAAKMEHADLQKCR
ncbi:hypothetical protein Poly24_18140 [Rosistilla carotiformis]|uniref:Uncharacterized protein n=1 Tax=Rosistilla carotiformis TaxID=2528017 RepID=A0A518JRF6_9BACT|nr:hypothetical protein Poly24_18140 [Rosistilla carotiformis]